MNDKNELEITNEDIELLKEMRKNCLKSNVYEDDKRLLKSNAITKFLMLYEENKKLNKQLEDKEDFIKNLQATKDRLDKYNYEITIQQQEFIKYLEDESKKIYRDNGCRNKFCSEILTKYKEIIGL